MIFPEDRPLLRFKAVRVLFASFVLSFHALTVTRTAINFGVLPWSVRELFSRQQIGLDLEGLRAVELQPRATASERRATHFEQRLADLEWSCAAQEHALRLGAGRQAAVNP